MKGVTVYMIPSPVWEDQINTIPQYTIEIIHQLKHFIVEKAKTARRYLKLVNHPLPLQELIIAEMSRDGSESHTLRDWTGQGHSVGVISEAGCPGVADPGTHLVRLAHQLKVRVVPCPGPSSIIQAVMVSGFSGQQFTFHGYLPNKKPELAKRLRLLEQMVIKGQGTQIFIETPYRNHFLLGECLQILHENTHLSIASQLNSPEEWVFTLKIAEWKHRKTPDLKNKPCIFSIGKLET